MEVKSILLDTNAYSDFARNIKWQSRIVGSRSIYVPLVVIGELRAGFRGGSQFYKNENDLQAFLSHGNVKVLHSDFQTTSYFATVFADLKASGHHIPQNDLWIAALALQHGLWLCTSDSHFDHIPQLLRATA